MKADVIFFAAHPDDAELCCGGTIYNFVKAGKTAGIIDLTQGELSTRGDLKTRAEETKNASSVLGISFRENLEIEDGNIENNKANRSKIIQAIRKYKPELIFLPYPGDRHPDHVKASELIREASFYSGLDKIETGTLNSHRAKRNVYYMQTYLFQPSFIIDISDSFEKKLEAIRCYKTQFFEDNKDYKSTFISDTKFIEFIKSRAKFYGFQIGKEYGEPFYTEESNEMKIENLIQ